MRVPKQVPYLPKKREHHQITDASNNYRMLHKITHPQDRFSKLGYSAHPARFQYQRARFRKDVGEIFPTTPCLIYIDIDSDAE